MIRGELSQGVGYLPYPPLYDTLHMYMCCTVLYCIAIPSSSRAVCQLCKDRQYKPIMNEVSPSYFSLVLMHSPMCVQVVCGEDALHKRLQSVERENDPLKQQLEQVPFAQ